MNNNSANPDARTLSIAITGSGGSGVVTTGNMLLKVIASAGFYGLMTRSAGPQIRGGESAAMVRIGTEPVNCLDDQFEILMALDWLNVSRFAEEIPLTVNSIIICDPEAGEIPAEISRHGARIMEVPLKNLSKEIKGGRINMVGLGVLTNLLGLSEDATLNAVDRILGAKGKEVVEASQQCIQAGYRAEKPLTLAEPISQPEQVSTRWDMSGNEASGLGALRGGIRFVAAYPITPASEILEWLAPNLEKVGGALLQAEDELASINMIIGASFGGVPSLTATSGPGLSLMMEGLGLAVTSETPVVVSNVMRGGPSTGIPTKSEQSDLNIAIYGFHGDAPHIVLSALDIGDCAFTTEWAVYLTEALQTVAIVLSDQSLGQARSVTDPPAHPPAGPGRRISESIGDDYQRYLLTEDAISPMAIPGTPGGIYTADGLEHNEKGTPSSMPLDHQLQLDKRQNKLTAYDFGDHWARIEGTAGDICLLTWGSSCGTTMEAARRLAADGAAVQAIAVRLLCPMPEAALNRMLSRAKRVLVVEQNHGGQFYHYLHSRNLLPDSARVLARPGPLPIRPNEIVTALQEWN